MQISRFTVLVASSSLLVGLLLGFGLGREAMRREVAKRFEDAFKGFPEAGALPSDSPQAAGQDMLVMNEAAKEYQLPALKLRIDGFEEKDTLTSGYMGPAKAKEGTKFVLVKVTVTNSEKEQFFFRPDSEVGIRLVDAQGRRYQESEDHWQGTEDYIGARTLGPGVPETGRLIYEVPVDATAYHLEAPK